VTDDGARRPDRDQFGRQIWFDSQLHMPCSFQPSSPDTFACAPIATFGDPGVSFLPVRAYSDAGCTQRIAFGPIQAPGSAFQASRDAVCGGASYAAVIEPQGATAVPVLYPVGQTLQLTTWYQRPLGEDTCTATPSPAGVQIVSLGPAVETTDLVVGHVQRVATGHRLSYRQVVAGDGTRERIGWYDTVTNLECTVQLAADGAARCLPEAEKVFFWSTAFSDAACTKPVVYVNEGDPLPAGLVQPDASSPGLPPGSYYRVGASATVLYTTERGSCAASPDAVDSVWHVTEEIPVGAFDAFIGANLTPDGARLAVEARTDDEGAIDPSPGITRDRTTKLACALGPTADGKTRCLPAASQQRYADMSCASTPFVTFASADPPSPRYASGWSGDFCTGGQTLYEAGAAIGPPADVYDTDGQGRGCARNPFASGSTVLTFMTVGNPVPASTFAEARLVTE
jgi:hypothetical protein